MNPLKLKFWLIAIFSFLTIPAIVQAHHQDHRTADGKLKVLYHIDGPDIAVAKYAIGGKRGAVDAYNYGIRPRNRGLRHSVGGERGRSQIDTTDLGKHLGRIPTAHQKFEIRIGARHRIASHTIVERTRAGQVHFPECRRAA